MCFTGEIVSRALAAAARLWEKGFKVPQNGCIRYYGAIDPSKKPGPMIGRRMVREWDPARNLYRTWHETLDKNLKVRIIRVENGDPKVHYMFNEQGTFESFW